MITLTAKKKETNVLTIPAPTRVSRGHQAHRSGAGVHAHRGTKRGKTRATQRQSALTGW